MATGPRISYSAAGELNWANSFGSGGDDRATDVAVDGAGNVLVAGDFAMPFSNGGVALSSAGGRDAFVVSYSAAGELNWASNVGGAEDDRGSAVAVDSGGQAVITGWSGDLNEDVLVARLDAAGTEQWSLTWGGSSLDRGRGVAVDDAGVIVVAGIFYGVATFGSSYELTSSGGGDLFVASCDTAGNVTWMAQGSSDASDVDPVGVALLTGSGDAVVAGTFHGNLDLGNGYLAHSTTAAMDVFVARYAESDGHTVWGIGRGGPDADYVRGVDVHPTKGEIAITGRFWGTADFSDGLAPPLSAPDPWDIFVVGYDADGVYLWGTALGAADSQHGLAVAFTGAGSVAVSGSFYDTAELGFEKLTAVGLEDVFLLELATP